MKEKVVYESFDGNIFFDKESCAKYEHRKQSLNALTMIEKRIVGYNEKGEKRSVVTQMNEVILIHILDNEIIDVYTSLKGNPEFGEYDEFITYLQKGWYFWDDDYEHWKDYLFYKKVIDEATSVYEKVKEG